MNSDLLQRELVKKANNGEAIASLVLENLDLIPDIVKGISSSSPTVRLYYLHARPCIGLE